MQVRFERGETSSRWYVQKQLKQKGWEPCVEGIYLYTIIWALPATASLLLEPILHVFQTLFCAFPLHLSCSKNTFIFSG